MYDTRNFDVHDVTLTEKDVRIHRDILFDYIFNHANIVKENVYIREALVYGIVYFSINYSTSCARRIANMNMVFNWAAPDLNLAKVHKQLVYG